MGITKTAEMTELILTDADYECIEEMVDFYEISREQALERFLSGDIDGVADQIDFD
ncbi:MAG: hypothetical protein K0R90_1334 [Oscillospiraceae bacterium]|jgi:hypothetical protein|nr:hypothetical protein [Oscillospiraceae bacterium]